MIENDLESLGPCVVAIVEHHVDAAANADIRTVSAVVTVLRESMDGWHVEPLLADSSHVSHSSGTFVVPVSTHEEATVAVGRLIDVFLELGDQAGQASLLVGWSSQHYLLDAGGSSYSVGASFGPGYTQLAEAAELALPGEVLVSSALLSATDGEPAASGTTPVSAQFGAEIDSTDTHRLHEWRGRTITATIPRDRPDPLSRIRELESVPNETLQLLQESGLMEDISEIFKAPQRVVSSLVEHQGFVSHGQVMDVLDQIMRTDPGPSLVLWRDDHTGFYAQKRASQFLDSLRRHKGGDEHIDQTRLRIFDERGEEGELATEAESSVINVLRKLHSPGQLRGLDLMSLNALSEPLGRLTYGFTVFPKIGLAVIPAPAAGQLAQITPDQRGLEDFLARETRYEPSDGPLRGVLLFDSAYVTTLAKEFDHVLKESFSLNGEPE